MASNFKAALFGISLCIALLNPTFSHASCGTLKQNLNAALHAVFIPVFTAKTDKGMRIMLLTNRTGEWVILGISETNEACPLARGYDIKIMIERTL